MKDPTYPELLNDEDLLENEAVATGFEEPGPDDDPVEAVMATASRGDPDPLPPEVDDVTANLTVWDEPAAFDSGGSAEEDELDAQHLVEAGNEEADRELRVASENPED
jgi:hypothetical protein